MDAKDGSILYEVPPGDMQVSQNKNYAHGLNRSIFLYLFIFYAADLPSDVPYHSEFEFLQRVYA